MMKSLLIAGAVTAAASANDIDLFATSSFDDSSYLMQQDGYWNPGHRILVWRSCTVGANGQGLIPTLALIPGYNCRRRHFRLGWLEHLR